MTHTHGLVYLSAALLCGCTSLTVTPVPVSPSASASSNLSSEDTYDKIIIETKIPPTCKTGFENLWITKNMNVMLFAQVRFDGTDQPIALPLYPQIAKGCSADQEVKVVQLLPYGKHATSISLRALSGSTTELTEFSRSSVELLSSLATGGLSHTLSTMKGVYETPQMQRSLAEYKAIESRKLYSSGTTELAKYGTYETTFYQVEYDQRSSQAKAVDQYVVPKSEDQFLVVTLKKEAIASQLFEGSEQALIDKAKHGSSTVPSKTLVGRTETIWTAYSAMPTADDKNCSAINNLVQQVMQLNNFDRVVVARALANRRDLLGTLDDYCEIPDDIRLLWKKIYPDDFEKMPELLITSMHKETWSKKVGVLLKEILNNLTLKDPTERQLAWKSFPRTRTKFAQKAHFNVPHIGDFYTPLSTLTDPILALSKINVKSDLVGCFTALSGNDPSGQLVFVEDTTDHFKFWKVVLTINASGEVSVDFNSLTTAEQQELRDHGSESSDYRPGVAHCPKILKFLSSASAL